MASVKFVCPQCHTSYNLDASFVGKRVQCDACNAKFTVGGQSQPAAPANGADEVVAQPVSMAAGPTPSRGGRVRPQNNPDGQRPEHSPPKERSSQNAKPKLLLSGALKDTLHREATPYEILEVSRDAAQAEVEKAFVAAIRKRVAPNVAKGARDILLRSEKRAERALCDVLLYDERHLGRLRLSPLQDLSVLDPANRRETAEAWKQQLKGSFPNVGIAHSLGVLWYWWTLHEEERQDALMAKFPQEALNGKQSKKDLLKEIRKKEGVRCEPGTMNCGHADCVWREDCCSSAPPLEEMWRQLIGYWSMLAASPEVWDGRMGLTESEAREVRRKIEDSLRNRLADHGQKYSQKLGAEHPLALRYRQLEVTLVSELKTAKVVAASGYRTKQGRVCAGVQMLRLLGLLEKMREQVEELLRRTPGVRELRQLKAVLSEHFEIAELLDGTPARPEEALRRIEALSANERKSTEVTHLQGRALMLLGRQQVSVGRLDDALESWGRALDVDLPEEVRQDLQREVVSTCHSRAVALQNRDADRAIDILEKGLVLIKESKLELMLAEVLTTRAISVFNKRQEELKGSPSATVRRQIVQDFRKAKTDLERAAQLGSKRAADNLKTAADVLAQLEEQMRNGLFDAAAEAQQLLEKADEAAAREAREAAAKKLRQTPPSRQPPSVPKPAQKPSSSPSKPKTSETGFGKKVGKILAATWWIWIWAVIWLFSKGCN